VSAFFKSPACPILSFADATALRAEPSALLHTGSFGSVDGSTDLVRYDSTLTDADDGVDFWKPNDVDVSDPGRWARFAVGGVSTPDFTDRVLHVNVGGAVPATGLYGLSVDYTAGANRRGVFWDPANATWACAQDTLGDDATISSYLDLRAKDVKVTSLVSDNTGNPFISMFTGDEIKARISATTYRMLAALAGPKLAVGDTALDQVTVDAASLLQMTSQLAAETRVSTTYSIKDPTGGMTLAQFSVAGSFFDVFARLRAKNGGTTVLDVDVATGTVSANGKLNVYDATGVTNYFNVSSGTTTVNGVFDVYDATGMTLLMQAVPAVPAVSITGALLVSSYVKTPQLDTASAIDLTVGGTATGVDFSGLALKRVAFVDYSGAVIDFGANTTGQNAGKSGTTWALRGALTVAGTSGLSDLLTVNRNGIGSTQTLGVIAANDTVSGTQYSPSYGWRSFHSGGTQHNAAVNQEIQSASRQKLFFRYGTGSSHPSSTFGYLDNSDPSYGVICAMSAFLATGVTGYRLTLNGGGVKENGSGRVLFQNATAGEPWEALSSTSTGNTGARFQFTADAGTPSAGYLARFGYGSGSFSTSKLDLYYDGRLGLANVDPTALGVVGMDASTGRLRLYVGGVAASVAVLSDIGGVAIQGGTATLSSGVTGNITAAITANTRIVVSVSTPSGTTLTTEWSALDADRTVGATGPFKITALLAAGTINTADNSTVNWVAFG